MARPASPRHIRVACLGDSITQGSPGYDPRRGGDVTSQWEHWAQLAEPKFELVNCGRYGQRTDEIACRFDECAAGAVVLVVQGGINDIAQGCPVTGAAACLQALVRRGVSAGLRVLLADLLPWNNGWPGAEPEIRRLNAALAVAARQEQVRLLGFHDALEDAGRPGRMREAWTADGDHPSVEGYRILGELVARELAAISPPR